MRISHGLCLVVSVIGTACSESGGKNDSDPGVDAAWTVEVERTHEGNGTVVSTVGGIACGSTCAAQVPDGTTMVLTAVPDAGAVFAGWSGPCRDATTTCTFMVSREVTVEAAFDVARPTVVVATYGDGGGRVAMAPAAAGCAGSCAVTVEHGAQLALTAVPDDGSEFLGWVGPDCSGAECTMTVTADQRVTAVFARHRSLVVIKTGSGDGTVASSPGEISCGNGCSQVYGPGTVVELTATPAAGAHFVGWRGGGCSGDGRCVVAVDAATLVEAEFSVTCSLSVVRVGVGRGRVTSSPRGISCGRTCSQAFACGTQVQLTAAPRQSTFSGWSGACSGTGPCTVTLVDASTTVDAAFTVCGNGVLEPGEQCDDGNQVSGDGCSATCHLEVCGNGIVDPGEQCDDGNQVSGDGCSATCHLEVCGNGIVDPGEQCDDGGNDTAVCNGDLAGAASCHLASCGDGYVNVAFTPSGGNAVEECDNLGGGDTQICNGNRGGTNGPGSCRRPACGDGYRNLAAGEQCDTLGGLDTASCNGSNAGAASCQLPRCGDGYVNRASGEQCDGGGPDTTTCNGSTAGSARCKIAVCGDGYANRVAGEQCDNLGGMDTAVCNGSNAGPASCGPARCGDGYVNRAAGEQCDNLFGADSATCNGSNAGPASCAPARCGDGYLNRVAGEQCDAGGIDTSTCNGPNGGPVGCALPRCGDGYINTAAGEQCETNLDCIGSQVCSGCRCIMK